MLSHFVCFFRSFFFGVFFALPFLLQVIRIKIEMHSKTFLLAISIVICCVLLLRANGSIVNELRWNSPRLLSDFRLRTVFYKCYCRCVYTLHSIADRNMRNVAIICLITNNWETQRLDSHLNWMEFSFSKHITLTDWLTDWIEDLIIFFSDYFHFKCIEGFFSSFNYLCCLIP